MPETTLYLVAALAISFAIVGAFITTIYLRFRNLARDMQMIEQLRDE